MCKESKKTTSSTQEQKLPTWLNEASQDVVSRATEYADQPFRTYEGARVADPTSDQQSAFQMLRDYVTSGGSGEAISKFKNAPAQTVSTERTVDEGGRLGSISDYVNPYVEGALAPALRKIQESADAARKRLGASSTMSGSFGDARHGVREAMLDRDTSTAMGDTTAQFMKGVYDTAMGQRSADLSRFGQTDQTNAQLGEQALQRSLTGGQVEQQQMLENIRALLSGGAVQQGVDQAKLDAAYQEFMRQYQHDPATLSLIASILGRVPTNKTVTGEATQTSPDNSLLGALGSAAGSFAGSTAGSTAIASLLAGI